MADKDRTPAMITFNTNNLIIGGGLAGLYCAWQMKKRGENFVLLEASSRFGGRIMAADANHSIDLGATWFWPHQTSMLALVQELSLSTFEQYIEGDTLFQSTNSDLQRMHYQHALSHRFSEGCNVLISALLNKLEPQSLKLNSPVKGISKSANTWQIQLENRQEQLQAQRLFIAVPPRQIVKHLNAENWLSPQTIDNLSAQQTWMSAQAKFVAIFDKPFWRDEDLSGFAISHKGPMVEIHDTSATDQSGALFGFIGIPATQRSKISEQELKSLCRRQLLDIYGSQAIPVCDYFQDWSAQQYIASERDIQEFPRHSQVSLESLYQNNDLNNIYFVASEFSAIEPGYMEGALDAVQSAIELAFNGASNQYRYPGQPSSLLT